MNEEFLDANLTLKHINSIDEFTELKEEWNNLLSNSRCLSVCLHWDWMNLWWKHFHTDNFELVLLTIRNESELVAIFPLVNIKKGKQQFLYFMGTGENEKEEITSEYIDIITKPGMEEAVCQLFLQHLKKDYTGWDRIELFRFLKNSTIASHFINEAWLQDFKYLRYLSGYRQSIKLDADFKNYTSKRSRSFRKNLRNYQNRLEKNGAVNFKIIDQHKDIDTVLDKLQDLHLQRFRFIKQLSAFESPKFTGFHRDLMHIMLDKDQLHLGILTIDDRIIAVEYNFSINRTTYAYQGSFDHSFKKLSAGFLSINQMIKNSIGQQKRIFDFMMNDQQAYMTSYGCENTPVLSCSFFNQPLKNRFIYMMIILKYFIKEAITTLKPKKKSLNSFKNQ
jgi:CelD/BcsL family acetyltransferase involved in cellulose biosynthesis